MRFGDKVAWIVSWLAGGGGEDVGGREKCTYKCYFQECMDLFMEQIALRGDQCVGKLRELLRRTGHRLDIYSVEADAYYRQPEYSLEACAQPTS